jgi:hypothetical protein
MNTPLLAQPAAAPKASVNPVQTQLLQREGARGGAMDGDWEGDSRENLSLQRSTRDPELPTHDSGGVPPIVHEVLRSPGQPLESQTRAFMEPRFGHNFSSVRVHTDSKAAESARAVNASAYTVGPHIAFAGSQYAPATARGQRLIAHELAHSIQQASATNENSTLELGQPTDSRESEADTAASQILSGQSPVSVSGTTAGAHVIQRQPAGEGPGESDAPSTTEVPVESGGGATPMTAPALPQPFTFTVPRGARRFSNVFRTPSSGNFSITARGTMSARPSTVSPFWIQPITSGWHLNGSEQEFTTGGPPVTRSWTDIATDVDCGLEISTGSTNDLNALTGSGNIS